MTKTLISYEQETIINFNKAEDLAHIFTYEKTWQKHLEGKLGLKPIMDNVFGGKEYEIPKTRIKPPRAPRKLSATAKIKLIGRLYRNRDDLSENPFPVAKSATKRKSKGNSILVAGIK